MEKQEPFSVNLKHMVLYEGVGVGFTGCVNYMKRKMKKGESACGISGRHLLLPLITLIFTTALVWSGQRTATLVFLERQLTTPSSIEFNVDTKATDVSELALKPKGSKEEGNSSENTPADRKQEERFDFQPPNFTSSAPYKNGSDTNAPVCNYGKGRWVADNRRPLYSGLECKRWLSGMWACRLTRRADFSYERYRWQPENCNMPEFDRTAFLKRMQDKTIAFIGDSIGRQQFQSLMCMATGGGESSQVEDVGIEYGLVKRPGAIRPAGYAYRFTNTNTTILYYWSSSLANLEPISGTDPIEGSKVAMHLDRPPKFLRRFFDQFDVIVLNTGHHWNKGKFKANRWVMYVNGKPNEDSELSRIGNAKNFTIRSIVKWLDSQVSLSPRTVKAFFRTISPRHFVNGEWNSGGNCDNSVPMTRGSEVVQGGSSDQLVEAAVNGTGVKILDITGLSKLRDEAHISRYSIKANHGINDCLHWCLPGVPDTWNELLTAQL